jgi:hypothetical protein
VIRINLLRSRTAEAKRARVLPVRPVLSILTLIVVIAAGFFLYQALSIRKSASAEHLKKIESVPFDAAEDIVDDIRGGRFKEKNPNRVRSLSPLSSDEKTRYERLFVKTVFDAFNASIQPGIGFNIIALDNEGNFFVVGVTQRIEDGNAFREELEKQDCILNAGELSFKKGRGESKTRFAMKGFLNYHILDRFYEPVRVNQNDDLKESRENVLSDIQELSNAYGLRFVKPAEWSESESFGTAAKHTVRLQIESTYGGLMKWINAMAERKLQIGFSRISLTTIGQGKILSAVECYVYAQN